MKTSFYFVVWIVIYPLLDLFGSRAVVENSFIVALLIVWGLSWVLNRMMPNILHYERISDVAPILEDAFSGNVPSFAKRVSRDALIETITAIYFCISTIVIAIAVFKYKAGDWLALAIFAFITFGIVSRSIKLIKSDNALKENPTQQECIDIAENTYGLNYSSYSEARCMYTYEAVLPPRPKNFTIFQIISIIIAAICAILGLYFVVQSILQVIASDHSIVAAAVSGMYFLYGSLAIYFGIKDIITIVQAISTHKKLKA